MVRLSDEEKNLIIKSLAIINLDLAKSGIKPRTISEFLRGCALNWIKKDDLSKIFDEG